MLRPSLAALALSLALTGCSGDDPGATPAPASSAPGSAATSATSAAPAGGRVALLMPGPPTMRSKSFDRATFAEAVAEDCADCGVEFYDAQGDAGTQAEQLARAVESGVGVVVINAVEPFTVAGLIRSAQERGVKVIGFDTLLEELDYYVAYDRAQGGTGQARALMRATGGSGPLVMLNGAPTDSSAVQVKAAAHAVIDASDSLVVGELDAVASKPKATTTWLQTILAFNPPDVLAGVYAADDVLAGVAIDVLLGAGADPGDLPPITGDGATLAGVKRIVGGRQLMTVYRPVDPTARTAAAVAVAALSGADPGEPTVELDGVPTYLLDPVVVTEKNLERTVVADGYWTAREICTKALRASCKDLGLL